MAYDHAPRILKDNLALIAQSAEGIYDDNLVILFWENVEPARINECIKYLNDDANSVVTGPVTYDDVLFSDGLYHLHAYFSESENRLYRIMMREPIDQLSDSDFTTAEGTKWKLIQGQTYAQGQSTVVIGMQNVTAEAALDFQLEGLAESYSSIFLLTGIEMTGAWYNMNRQIQVNNNTGLYTVLWELNSFAGSEVGFIYKDTFGSVITEVNVIESNEDIIQEFLATHYFDSLGNWYYSDDGGLTYCLKNGSVTSEINGFTLANAFEPRADGLYTLTAGTGKADDEETVYENANGFRFTGTWSEWGVGQRDGFTVYDGLTKLGNINASTGQEYLWEIPITTIRAVDELENVTIEQLHQLVPADAALLSEAKSGRSVRARSFYDEREKNWNVQFIVRHIDNENDYIFNYKRSSQETEALFFKLNMPSTDIDAFLENYYFDEDGNYYLTDDAGVNYIEKNGTPTATATMPTDAENLRTIVSGRIADVSVSPDDQLDTVSVRARIVWGSDIDESGFIYQAQNDTIATEVELVAVSETRRDEFLEYTYTDSDGNWYYAVNGDDYTSKNGDSNDTGSFTTEEITAVKLDAAQEGRSLRVQTSYIESKDRWNLRLSFQYGDSELRLSRLGAGVDDDVSVKPTPDTVLTIDKGFNLTRLQVASIETYYNAACPAGTTRRVEINPRANGYFDYDAIEIVTTGVLAEFAIGKKTNFFGFHYQKKPTTDVTLGNTGATSEWSEDADGNVANDTHVLLGGSLVETPVQVDTVSVQPYYSPTSGGNGLAIEFPPSTETENGRPKYTSGKAELSCKNWGDGALRWGFKNNYDPGDTEARFVEGPISPSTAFPVQPYAVFLHGTDLTGLPTSELTPPLTGWQASWYTGPVLGESSEDLSIPSWSSQWPTNEPIVAEIQVDDPGGAVTKELPASSTLSDIVDITESIRYEEDGTWSWNISSILPSEEESYPESASSYLIKTGLTDRDVFKWKGRKNFAVPSSAVDATTTYSNITVDDTSSATNLTLKGRRVTVSLLRNQRIDDNGLMSYDIIEREITAQVQADDAWFFVGVTHSVIRETTNVKSSLIAVDGTDVDSYPTVTPTSFWQKIINNINFVNTPTPGNFNFVLPKDDETGSDHMHPQTLFDASNLAAEPQMANIPIFAVCQTATKRARSVKKERKYFARRPTATDLANCYNVYNGTTDPGSLNETLDEAIARVGEVNPDPAPATGPDVLVTETFSVVRLGGEHSWAVEKTTVTISDETYDDPDARVKLTDSSGDSLFKFSMLGLHAASTWNTGGANTLNETAEEEDVTDPP